MYCPLAPPSPSLFNIPNTYDKLWVMGVERLSSYYRQFVLWRMQNAAEKFDPRIFRSRRHPIVYMSIRFSYCLVRNASDSNSAPSIAWAIVVPFEHSVKFHKDFATRKPIDPEKYGLEFWYNPETIAIHRQLKKLFSSTIKEQIGKLGLRAIRKTDNQMNELITTVPNLSISHKTPKQAKDWAKQLFQRTVSAASRPFPYPVTGDTEDVLNDIGDVRSIPNRRGLLDQVQNVEPTYSNLTIDSLHQAIHDISLNHG